jgi:hypothetical protein
MIYLDLKAYTYLILLLNKLAVEKYNDLTDALSFDYGAITTLPTGATIYHEDSGYYVTYFRLYFHSSDYERETTLTWLDKHGIEYEDVSKDKK